MQVGITDQIGSSYVHLSLLWIYSLEEDLYRCQILQHNVTYKLEFLIVSTLHMFVNFRSECSENVFNFQIFQNIQVDIEVFGLLLFRNDFLLSSINLVGWFGENSGEILLNVWIVDKRSIEDMGVILINFDWVVNGGIIIMDWGHVKL